MRAVTSKMTMDKPNHRCEDLQNDTETVTAAISPSNLFAAVTCVSFIFSIPLAILFEGQTLVETMRFLATKRSSGSFHDVQQTCLYILTSGLFHYLNNEVMYAVLDSVHPITLAVGNTLKRVFIIISGVLVFSTPITWQTSIGSTIGIGGVLIYSLMKQWYDTDQIASISHLSDINDEDLTELVECSSDDTDSNQNLVSRKHNTTL